MKILVTGGNGFIGSHLCRSLSGEEHEVFTLAEFIQLVDQEVKHENSIDYAIL